MYKVSIFLLTILCFSCSSEQAGLDELKKLCEKDAGISIYKTVEADGYYDSSRKSGALRLLIDSDYGFTEFCNLEPNITSLFDESGCWRLTKISRDTGQCNEMVDEILNSSGGYSYPEFRGKNCISVERLNKSKARYVYHSELKEWFSENGKSEFQRSDSYIKDSRTLQILGRYVSYSYNPRPGHSTAKSCEIFGDYPSYYESKLINTVLKSI